MAKLIPMSSEKQLKIRTARELAASLGDKVRKEQGWITLAGEVNELACHYDQMAFNLGFEKHKHEVILNDRLRCINTCYNHHARVQDLSKKWIITGITDQRV